ncbi:MAG: phage holin family protein [Candidatus Daviesbacteria bacterium]|nr:phage holin family protein [Candidatus Daviesbacteria bacterium]
MKIILNWLISGFVIFMAAYLFQDKGVHVDNFYTALIIAVVLGIINAILKPILLLLTLPINILSLGLFTLIINAVLIMLATLIVPGFRIDSFWSAFLFGIVLSLLNWFVSKLG